MLPGLPLVGSSAPVTLAVPARFAEDWIRATDGDLRPLALATQRGATLAGMPALEIREGVAVLSVFGPLFHYPGRHTRAGIGTAYADLTAALVDVLANRRVRAILLDVDSLGGQVAGCAELAERIFAARGAKPVVAYVSDLCAAAAYWLASAAEEVVISQTAILGGLGLVSVHRDRRARDAGTGTLELVSSQSPKKRPDPASKEGRSQLQRTLDDLADVMLSAVARHRGVSMDLVLTGFGEGGLLVGRAAVVAGLADRLGSFEHVLAELAAGKAPAPASTSLVVSARGLDASPAPRPRPAAPAARAGDPAAEARRQAAVRELELPGFESVIAAALADPDCTPEMAARRILAAQAKRL